MGNIIQTFQQVRNQISICHACTPILYLLSANLSVSKVLSIQISVGKWISNFNQNSLTQWNLFGGGSSRPLAIPSQFTSQKRHSCLNRSTITEVQGLNAKAMLLMFMLSLVPWCLLRVWKCLLEDPFLSRLSPLAHCGLDYEMLLFGCTESVWRRRRSLLLSYITTAIPVLSPIWGCTGTVHSCSKLSSKPKVWDFYLCWRQGPAEKATLDSAI